MDKHPSHDVQSLFSDETRFNTICKQCGATDDTDVYTAPEDMTPQEYLEGIMGTMVRFDK